MRKAFHLASPAWLVWYWLPPDAWIGVRKEAVLIVLLSVTLLIEAGRLISGRHLLGFRDYESDRLSANAWGALGLAMALLFFPGQFVIPAFWGMAWIDPLCAYTRKHGGYPWVPLAAYALLAALLLLFVVPLAVYQTTAVPPPRMALYVPLAAVAAIASERPKLRHVDDDFIMHVVPLLTLTGASLLLPR